MLIAFVSSSSKYEEKLHEMVRILMRQYRKSTVYSHKCVARKEKSIGRRVRRFKVTQSLSNAILTCFFSTDLFYLLNLFYFHLLRVLPRFSFFVTILRAPKCSLVSDPLTVLYFLKHKLDYLWNTASCVGFFVRDSQFYAIASNTVSSTCVSKGEVTIAVI